MSWKKRGVKGGSIREAAEGANGGLGFERTLARALWYSLKRRQCGGAFAGAPRSAGGRRQLVLGPSCVKQMARLEQVARPASAREFNERPPHQRRRRGLAVIRMRSSGSRRERASERAQLSEPALSLSLSFVCSPARPPARPPARSLARSARPAGSGRAGASQFVRLEVAGTR